LDAVHAHAVVSLPEPRYDAADKLKAYPCGQTLASGVPQYNNWESGTPVTVMYPGWQAIEFRETINHNGAPYRLALSFNDDDNFNTHVLLDQIPHNDEGTTSGSGKMHRVWVDVPDVDCRSPNRCSLQLIQVMTDKFPAGYRCLPGELATSCGNANYVYFSCANVEIQGSGTFPPAEFYKSFDGATSAEGWVGVSTSWRQGNDGVWEIPGQNGADTTSTPAIVPLVLHPHAVAGLFAGGFAVFVIGVFCYYKMESDQALKKALETNRF